MQPRNAWSKKPYLLRVLIGLDQFVNAILGGNPDLTISGRIGYRIATNQATKPEKALCWVLRKFENKHCLNSIELDEVGGFNMAQKSNAIMYEDELLEHFSDETNHYLYKKRDDNTLVCWMCCDFELIRTVDGAGVIDRGGCGDGVVYDLTNKTISIERGQ